LDQEVHKDLKEHQEQQVLKGQQDQAGRKARKALKGHKDQVQQAQQDLGVRKACKALKVHKDLQVQMVHRVRLDLGGHKAPKGHRALPRHQGLTVIKDNKDRLE
jgi:predicted phage gp36 major capsid-like protein